MRNEDKSTSIHNQHEIQKRNMSKLLKKDSNIEKNKERQEKSQKDKSLR